MCCQQDLTARRYGWSGVASSREHHVAVAPRTTRPMCASSSTRTPTRPPRWTAVDARAGQRGDILSIPLPASCAETGTCRDEVFGSVCYDSN